MKIPRFIHKKTFYIYTLKINSTTFRCLSTSLSSRYIKKLLQPYKYIMFFVAVWCHYALFSLLYYEFIYLFAIGFYLRHFIHVAILLAVINFLWWHFVLHTYIYIHTHTHTHIHSFFTCLTNYVYKYTSAQFRRLFHLFTLIYIYIYIDLNIRLHTIQIF